MNAKLRSTLRRALTVVDEHDLKGARLLDDAQRTWQRVRRFLDMGLIGPGADVEALELACYAMQLPLRQVKMLPAGRLGRTNLRDRAEQSAELLVGLLGEQADESLLDRATRMLHESPQRSPVLDEAKVLADAVNLDDFGVTGLFMQAIQISRQGDGLSQVAEGCEKREQYGYWEARLKDGFHFEPVRQIATRRLAESRRVAALLLGELAEDRARENHTER
jgi:hypothetical protein